ncbi:recombination regulator RecX [Clostridium estertheticum]|uniref:recombination regulator RecX n=1 Tax=Clostridium estertheticum TaxID=238834 RepID=UPI001CCA64ED|nr:recombination regulator RecX [Clostridium estertheticum]MBZ9608924.1 recombination regulator RecX [Clostridium estertheticum]
MSSIITKIEIQKKNKRRVNIYMDGEYAFACDAELIYIHNITKGRVMDKQNLEDIASEDNYIKGKTCALHFLERSNKSAKQVVDKLTIKEFDTKTIDRVLEFLKQYDFIDDKRFVELFIKEKIRSSGKNKIKFALLKKSLPKELIKEELNKITNEQQLETALKLGEKKIVTISKSEKDTKKLYKKTSDYLARSGYDYEIIKEVLAKITENDKGEESCDNAPSEDTYQEDYDKLYELASKRYSILIKSESHKIKLYKKLGDYLLRRGFQWDQIKKVLKDLINGTEDIVNESGDRSV